MSPPLVVAKVHLTFNFDAVLVEIGSAAEVPPRVLQTFWPYIAQSPASLLAQSSGGGGAGAVGAAASGT